MRKHVCFCMYAKTKVQINCAVTDQRLATKIVQSLYFLNPKFQTASQLLCTAQFVSDVVGNPDDRFSRDAAQFEPQHEKTGLGEFLARSY